MGILKAIRRWGAREDPGAVSKGVSEFREELRRPYLPKGKKRKAVPQAKGFGAQFGRSLVGAFGGGQALRSTIKNVSGNAPDLKELRKKKIRPIKDYTPEADYEPGIVVFRG